ncbi:MAG: GGDEF domain-containing protein [Oscillospiraceae bacterium]|nr:GGDEF domain-containing protein [Oscillospiraceae bacterium]
MENLWPLLAVIQHLLVNLSTVHICLKKRKTTKEIILTLAAFSVPVLLIGEAILSSLPGYIPGNGYFVLVGFIYLLPIHRLYIGSLAQKFIIVCASWTYSLSVYSLSYHISLFTDFMTLSARIFIVQAIFFLLTDIIYKRFMRKYFVFVMRSIAPNEQSLLKNTCILAFLLIYTTHLSFVFFDQILLRVAATVLMFFHVIYSYKMIRRIIKSLCNLRELEGQIKYDALTNLLNRSCFNRDAYALLRNKTPFHLIFIDLDNFKSVNDTLGHLAGDEYLKSFSQWASDGLGNQGILYRLAGDEFVCIYKGRNPETFIRQIATSGPPDTGCKFAFQGASTGLASYPKDGMNLEHLIACADHNMYKNKQKKQYVKQLS